MFLYWTTNGLCYVGRAIEQPLTLSRETYEDVIHEDPRPQAVILIELDIMHPRPTSVFVKLHGQSDDFMAQVGVSYQDILQCSFCLSSKHIFCSCQALNDLIPMGATHPKQGFIFLSIDQTTESSAYSDEPTTSALSGSKKRLRDDFEEECQSALKPHIVANYGCAGLLEGVTTHNAGYGAHTQTQTLEE